MAAAILKSEIADKASVKVVEDFVAMRRFLSANSQVFQRLETIEYKLLESDQKFEDIYSKLEEKSLKPQHDAQYPPIPVQVFSKSHDRFLIIDDRVYHVGASIKDLGKKWFAILEMKDQNPNELISKL